MEHKIPTSTSNESLAAYPTYGTALAYNDGLATCSFVGQGAPLEGTFGAFSGTLDGKEMGTYSVKELGKGSLFFPAGDLENKEHTLSIHAKGYAALSGIIVR